MKSKGFVVLLFKENFKFAVLKKGEHFVVVVVSYNILYLTTDSLDIVTCLSVDVCLPGLTNSIFAHLTATVFLMVLPQQHGSEQEIHQFSGFLSYVPQFLPG